MPYVAVRRCKKCDTILSSREIYDMYGVCPYCGAMGSGSIVPYVKESQLVGRPKQDKPVRHSWWRELWEFITA